MSNPGLAKCKNCGKDIEHRETRLGFLWLHRATSYTLCSPSAADGVDTWAQPITGKQS